MREEKEDRALTSICITLCAVEELLITAHGLTDEDPLRDSQHQFGA